MKVKSDQPRNTRNTRKKDERMKRSCVFTFRVVRVFRGEKRFMIFHYPTFVVMRSCSLIQDGGMR